MNQPDPAVQEKGYATFHSLIASGVKPNSYVPNPDLERGTGIRGAERG